MWIFFRLKNQEFLASSQNEDETIKFEQEDLILTHLPLLNSKCRAHWILISDWLIEYRTMEEKPQSKNKRQQNICSILIDIEVCTTNFKVQKRRKEKKNDKNRLSLKQRTIAISKDNKNKFSFSLQSFVIGNI